MVLVRGSNSMPIIKTKQMWIEQENLSSEKLNFSIFIVFYYLSKKNFHDWLNFSF